MTVALLALLTIAGKITALIKDIVFASLFGVSQETDAYFIANQIPGVIWLAIYGTIGSIFTPLYIRKITKQIAAQQIVVESIRYYAYAGALVGMFGWLFAEALVTTVAPSIGSHARDLSVELLRIMLVGVILTGYVGIQSAIQQANRHFIPPLAIPVANNLLAIVAIVVAYWLDDVKFAAIGAVGAYFIQCLIQRRQTRDLYRAQWGFRIRRETWTRLSLLSAPLMLAVLLEQINVLIGTSIASQFGTGAISHLNYANRLAVFISITFSWLVAYLFFPALASNAAKNDDVANADLLTRAIGLTLVVTAPVAAGALALRKDVISIVYERAAFQSEDVLVTAGIFGILGLGVIFVALRELLNRIFFSYQKPFPPLLIGLVAVIVNVIASVTLSRSFGLMGVAAGASISAVTYCGGQALALALWKPQLLTRSLAVYFLSAVLAGGASYLAVEVMCAQNFNFSLFSRVAIASLIIASVYSVLLVAFLAMGGVRPVEFFTLLRKSPGSPNG